MAEPSLLVVDKPGGITSHQVVSRARRALGTRKVGHAGTLDPLATGVLVLGVDKGTRLLGHLALTTKTYEATIRLGVATTTDDAEGEPTATAGATLATVGPRLRGAVDALTGTILQVPSTVSAIKVNGQRAYALARRGHAVELAGREVTVSRFDVRDVREAECHPSTEPGGGSVRVVDLEVVVDCSSGTYVRALARDLGEALRAGGHLTALRRTRVGPFTLEHATWDGHLPDLLPGQLFDVRPYPLARIAPLAFATLEVDDRTARDVGYGRPLALAVPADPTALVHDGRLLALYRPAPEGSVPVAVLA